MRGPPALRGLAAVVVVLALTGGIGLIPGTPIASWWDHAPGSRNGTPITRGSPASAVHFAGPPDSAVASPSLAIGRCAILQSRFGAVFNGPAPPPTLAPPLSGCSPGNDEAGLGLLSNASASGARVSLTLQLPSAAGGAAGGMLAYEVRMWVSGVPCSMGGASLLSIDLIPPFGGTGSASSSNWSVWAPVYDLVPAGGCDPRCENSTALFNLPGTGRAFCEEDAVARGPEAGPLAEGSVLPGDRVNLTLVGASGGTGGLSVYLNDSTTSGLNLSWGYPNTTTISRLPIEPLVNVSDAGSAVRWASGPALSLAAVLCPFSTPSSGVGPGNACNSYNGPSVNASVFPRLSSVDSWNSSVSAYADPYPDVEMYSSSGACSGSVGVVPCSHFSTVGGTGTYPHWSLSDGIGHGGWQFGGPGPASLRDLGAGFEFNSTGAVSSPVADIGIGSLTNRSTPVMLTVNARIASPVGIGPVQLSVYFCTVSPTSPALVTVLGGKDVGATNTSADGNFSARVSFNHPETGSAYYWLSASTSAGGTMRAGPYRAPITGGGNTCTDGAPPTPDLTAANVTAVGGGYLLNFTENDSAVANYTLWITPDFAPYVPFSRSLTTLGPTPVLFHGDGHAYNLSMTATDVAGLTSTASVRFTAPTVPTSLSLTASTPSASDLWVGADTTAVNLTALGGAAPYTFHLDYGDGTTLTATNGVSWENLTHDFGGFDGVAMVRVSVTDADGLAAVAAPLGISILAGPLAPVQSLSAGAFEVRLSWAAPASPASPVTGYTVFYTNRSTEAPIVAGLWPSNDSAVGGFLWNTTATSLEIPNVVTGAPVYAVVVARDALGIGTLPAGWLQTPSATPLNLTASPISVTPTGGPAPLTIQVSDTITLGTNGTLVEGLYSFGSVGSVPANLTSNLTGPVAIWWLNASWTFPDTGSEIIVLHASDPFSDTVIPITSVYVGPAATPSAVARVTSGTPLVDQPVQFDGIAGGGTGVFTFNWSFGDGGTGTGAMPSHVYTSAGNYTALLEVTDSGDGLTTQTPVNLTVFANPSVFIEASALGASGQSYRFTAIEMGGVGGLSYSWTFGDGTTDNGASVNHTYGTPGQYNVSVTVTDSLRHSAVAGIVIVAPAGSSTVSPSAPALTGTELAAYALLGALAVVLFIGLLYYWSKSREPPEGPEPPDRFPIERVRARPPPDPPDPS
ncbi:MAG: PKD domain-containing protein [Thermoplasmata archaeon]|nr:PKD domain-containing protein [Thermoplasmata archaeon]